jgi:hypothetical protein
MSSFLYVLTTNLKEICRCESTIKVDTQILFRSIENTILPPILHELQSTLLFLRITVLSDANLKVETAESSEKVAPIYQTTQRYVSDDHNLHTHW